MKLKIGDKVKWRSRNGFNLSGEIIAVVPAGIEPQEIASTRKMKNHTRRKKIGSARAEKSFFVALDPRGGHYFWPDAHRLELI